MMMKSIMLYHQEQKKRKNSAAVELEIKKYLKYFIGILENPKLKNLYWHLLRCSLASYSILKKINVNNLWQRNGHYYIISKK